MPSTRWSRSCSGPTSSAASSVCRKPCVRRPTVAIRWSSRYNEPAGPRVPLRERLIDAGAVLDHPDAEQRGLRRSAVPVVVGLFPDLRPDADTQPGARRILHARRVFRLHAAAAQPAFLAGRARRRPRGGADRHSDGAVRAAPARRQRAGTGAGHARRLLHHRRYLPPGLDRRSHAVAGSAGVAPAAAVRGFRLSHLSAGGAGDCARRRARALPAHGAHPARGHDPRRRRRHGDGARRRHPGVAAVHHRVPARRHARRNRRGARRADPQRLSRPRHRHAAACADRRDPGRRGQPARRLRRQLHRRLHLQFRQRVGARPRLFRAVPADGAGARVPAAGAVRAGAVMTAGPAPASEASAQRGDSKVSKVIAFVVTALLLLALPWVIGNEFYVNMASQVLIYALFALSINMMLGYGGMVSLGHAGYLGIAGYACILLTVAGYDQLTAAIFAVALSTVAAAFFGVLSLRAPGLGFIMITPALGQIVSGVAYRANDLTGGVNGILHPARPMPF